MQCGDERVFGRGLLVAFLENGIGNMIILI